MIKTTSLTIILFIFNIALICGQELYLSGGINTNGSTNDISPAFGEYFQDEWIPLLHPVLGIMHFKKDRLKYIDFHIWRIIKREKKYDRFYSQENEVSLKSSLGFTHPRLLKKRLFLGPSIRLHYAQIKEFPTKSDKHFKKQNSTGITIYFNPSIFLQIHKKIELLFCIPVSFGSIERIYSYTDIPGFTENQKKTTTIVFNIPSEISFHFGLAYRLTKFDTQKK